jgi:plastocyanin
MASSFAARAALPLAILALAAGFSLAGDSPALAGGGCHGTSALSGTGTEVVMRGACFEPVVLYVNAGDTVNFTNGDPIEHVVTGAANSFSSQDLVRAGEAVSFSFDKPGVYPYACHLHPAMSGAIVVGDAAVRVTMPGEVQQIAVRVEAPRPAALEGSPASVSTGSGGGVEAWQVSVAVAAALAGIAGAIASARLRRSR